MVKRMFLADLTRCLARILVLGIFFAGSTACETDTRVAISNPKNPPQFTLSGSGRAASFFVVGPFENVEDLSLYRPEVHAIWEISAREYGEKSVARLPPITYGIVPSDFTQKKPEAGPPRALEEGKFYRVTAPSVSAGFRALCFTIDQGNAVKVTCDER